MNVFHHPPSSARALALLMLVGVCFPALLAGCSKNAASSQIQDPDPVIEITSPEPGKIVNTTRVTIKGRAENVEEVQVNGTPASVVGGIFETKVTLPEGAATVEVTAREVSDEVSFTVDVSPPVLELTSPTRGQHIDEADGKSVLVAGKVVDTGAGLSLFKINEQIIEPGDDGSFSYEQRLDPGLNEITLTAIDLVENSEDTIIGVMYGSYVDPTSKIEDGFEIEIAATAFPKVAEVIKKLLTPELVESLVKQNLPIEEVNITRVSFAPVEIEAIPRSNQLDPNAPGYIDFEVKVSEVDIAGDFMLSDNLIELDVQVSEATITTSMTIQADGQGSIDIAFSDSLLDLPDGALSWTVKSGGSELSQEDSDLLAGIIEDIARFAFSELLSEQIIEQLYDPAILTRTIEVFGRQMTFKLDIEEIITNASGLYVNASLAMPQDKFAQIPDVPGALMLPLGVKESPMLERDGVVTSNEVAINRLLHGVWRSGLFNQSLQGDDFAGFELPIKLEAGALALLLDGRVTNHADSNSPAGINVRPQLPPVLALDRESEGNAVIVRMAEVHMDLMLDVDKPQPKKLLTLAMFLDIGVEIEIEGTEVSFKLDVAGRADLVDEPLFDLEDAQVEKLLNTVFLLVPKVISQELVVGGEANLEWASVTNPEIKIHGLERDQVSVGLDIEANPEALEE